MKPLIKIVARALSADDTSLLTGLFFGMLFLGLFFGDGKQSVVEVYGAAVVLILWAIRASKHGLVSYSLPRAVALSWVGVFGVSAISTVASDSVGFSLSWLIRLLSGYLVYRLFYDISSEKIEKTFSRSLFVLVSAACLVAVVFMVFPRLGSALPSMNLVNKNYGHNHLADLLLFIAPLVWNSISVNSFVVGATLITAYVLLLSSTLARAAWVLASTFFVFVSITNKKSHAAKVMAVVLCFSAAVGVLYFGKFYTGQAERKNSLEQYTRPKSAAVRFEYWRQAIEGFVARPIIGNGPGTFSLVSYRYQRIPLSYSWFAHSQPLQILSEMGLLGFVAFGALIFFHARIWYVHRKMLAGNPAGAALAAGCALIMGYSLFEFVLDYFIVWLLVFAVAGLVTGRTQEKRKEPRFAGGRLSLIIMSVYYVFWISSNGAALFTKRSDIAFFLAPFDSTQTLQYLEESKTAQGHGVWAAKVFHKKNPQILETISLNMLSAGMTKEAIGVSREAVLANPQNIEYLGKYLALLSSNNDNAENVGNDLLLFLFHATPTHLHPQIKAFIPEAKQLGGVVRDIYRVRKPPLREGYISLLYLIGLKKIPTNPWGTEALWKLAIGINPDFATTYIELAMYYQHVRHNNGKAQNILRECAAHESARAQCESMFDKDLLPPGDYITVLQ